MIRFLSITPFRTALDTMLKVQGIPIEQIRANRDMILMDDDSIFIKLRLPDKKQRLSKADGYRLIYMVMKNVPVVVFLSIYPKRGPMQKIDLEEHELERLMNTFTTEFNSQQTVFHDIDNSLEVTSIH